MLEFDQSPWLKQYIDFITEKRKNAKNSFEKDFFKLMNNSIFGKTMENLLKWVDVRLMTDKKKLDKLTSKPTSVSNKIFNKNLMAVHKIKESQTLNRPAYVGMCILDLSKMLMYTIFIMGISKGCMAIKPNYCLQTWTCLHMRLKWKMYTKTFGMTKTC